MTGQAFDTEQSVSIDDIRLYIGSAVLENLRLAGQVKALKEEINRLLVVNDDLSAKVRQGEMDLIAARGKKIIDSDS